MFFEKESDGRPAGKALQARVKRALKKPGEFCQVTAGQWVLMNMALMIGLVMLVDRSLLRDSDGLTGMVAWSAKRTLCGEEMVWKECVVSSSGDDQVLLNLSVLVDPRPFSL